MNEQSPLRWKYPGPASSMDGSLSGPAFVLLMLSSGITYSTPVLFHLFEADFGIERGQAAFVVGLSVGLLAARPRAWIAGCIEMTLCANSAHPTKCPRARALACFRVSEPDVAV